MTWSDVTGFLGVVIACVAVVLSMVTVAINREQRRQDNFLRINEVLISRDNQRGRRLLYSYARTGELPSEGSEDYAEINRTLAAHDVAATYIRRGILSRRWFLDSWHHTLQDMRPGIELFIAHRQGVHGWRVWTDLELLTTQAMRFRTSLPCCQKSKAETNANAATSMAE
jgi:hypothetical protein